MYGNKNNITVLAINQKGDWIIKDQMNWLSELSINWLNDQINRLLFYLSIDSMIREIDF